MARGLRGSELPSKALEKNYASARDLFGHMQGGLGNHIRQYLAPLQRWPTASINVFQFLKPKRMLRVYCQ